MYEELDAWVLASVGRRLFAESAEAFFGAHASGMKSLSASSQGRDELGRAIEEEKKALSQQREAIHAQRAAWHLLSKDVTDQ
ncbi:MAG TPA: hypothetical protein VJM12_03070 [Pyrinomonadaceae bacterium]|nr:hypothetical protein [Pyrinomonadaceae bacterium]